MKRTVLCLLLVLILSIGAVASADSSTGFDTKSLTEDYLIVVNADEPDKAVCGLEKNADARCYPASTTKILTCIIALEEGDLDQKITIPASADSDRVAGTTMGLQKNEVFTLRDLIYGMMLPSGNDAAIAIAIGMCGSVSAFADRMNEKAAEIGMTNSHFANANGLHSESHYTTARDMAILAAYAMQNESFRKVVATTDYTAVSIKGRRVRVRTTNRYMRNYTSDKYKPQSVLWDEAIGIKTGETPYAGKCFVAAAERNGTVYIAALFHGDMPSSSASLKKQDSYSVVRFKDARALIEYAFEHDLRTITADDLEAKGVQKTFRVEYDPSIGGILSASYLIEWDQEASFSAPACSFPEELAADLLPDSMIRYHWADSIPEAGANMGTVEIRGSDTVYFSGSIVCTEVEKPTPEPTAEPTPVPTSTPTPEPEIVIVPVPIETPEPSVSTVPTETPARSSFLSCAPEKVDP